MSSNGILVVPAPSLIPMLPLIGGVILWTIPRRIVPIFSRSSARKALQSSKPASRVPIEVLVLILPIVLNIALSTEAFGRLFVAAANAGGAAFKAQAEQAEKEHKEHGGNPNADSSMMHGPLHMCDQMVLQHMMSAGWHAVGHALANGWCQSLIAAVPLLAYEIVDFINARVEKRAYYHARAHGELELAELAAVTTNHDGDEQHEDATLLASDPAPASGAPTGLWRRVRAHLCQGYEGPESAVQLAMRFHVATIVKTIVLLLASVMLACEWKRAVSRSINPDRSWAGWPWSTFSDESPEDVAPWIGPLSLLVVFYVWRVGAAVLRGSRFVEDELEGLQGANAVKVTIRKRGEDEMQPFSLE